MFKVRLVWSSHLRSPKSLKFCCRFVFRAHHKTNSALFQSNQAAAAIREHGALATPCREALIIAIF